MSTIIATQQPQEQATTEPTMLLWASFMPVKDNASGSWWSLSIRATVGGQRHEIRQDTMRTADETIAALAAADRMLDANAYRRASAWEPGSDLGFVARIDLDADQLFDAWEDEL